MKIKIFLLFLGSITTSFLLNLAHSAEHTYPTKPISIVLPYASGSSSDTLTRLVAQTLQQSLGQPVIVESKPGAGGSLGLEYVARAAPDGYTLVLTGTGSVAINPHIYPLRYSPIEDLTPITTLVEIPFVFVVNNQAPVKDLKDFIALARQKPGRVTSGNAGVGTQAHLTQSLFMKAANIDINLIAYKGGAPAANDLMGGHLDSMIDNAASQVPYITSNKVKALFVTSNYRFPSFPDVPTAEEAGLSNFNVTGWFGLAAPKGTPLSIIAKLNHALSEGFKSPEIRKRLVELGFVVVVNSSVEASSRAKDDYVKFEKVVKELNIKVN